jgi:serine/threonine protein kinase
VISEPLIFKLKDGTTKIISKTERRLGKGGQGSVFYAIDETDNKEYAVKMFDKEPYYNRELELLLKVNKYYAVELHGQTEDPIKSRYYLLLELFNCDLQKLIAARKIIPEREAEIIINQLFCAQHALYQQGCVHRDLKPSNVGLHFDDLKSEIWSDETAMAEYLKNFDFAKHAGKFKFKFFDLGLSETLDENGFASTSDSGTPFYSSPE